MKGTTLGVDIGGTFTDCVALRGEGIHIGKALSTPPAFHDGFVDAIAAVGEALERSTGALLGETDRILHGCTVGTNALVERRTAKVGLLTTRGHRDSIFSMQSGRRLRALPPQEIAQIATHAKPEPIVPRSLVRELDERVAADGAVVAPLDELQVREAIAGLVEDGVEALAVSLLWSVANPAHEKLVRRVAAELAPDLYLSVASEIAPRTGEYERTVATVVNSLIGPEMERYLAALDQRCAELGYAGGILIMTCSGGLISTAEARERPLLTIGSGPVAGLIGAARLAEDSAGHGNLITADMGGTTLDVGVVDEGTPLSRPSSWYEQFEYFTPTLDVRSVGSGGGSIVRFDAVTKTLSVGPRSAGSRPGPACYGRGGTEPTVTDADLVAGFLNPDYFLGGHMDLDLEAARTALARVGDQLGLSPEETAVAALRVVDNQMADAIRLVTVNQGLDPREFALYACGGAGAVHAPAIAAELGIRRIIVPLGDLASGWSAFGVAGAHPLVVEELATPMREPFDLGLLDDQAQALAARVEERLLGQGVDRAAIEVTRQIDMRYSLQVNELAIEAPADLAAAGADPLIERFEEEYARRYGADSGYSGAGFAITALRVFGRGPAAPLDYVRQASGTAADPIGAREVRFHAQGGGAESTPIYGPDSLQPGVELSGPGVVELPDTSIVIPRGWRFEVDQQGSAHISIDPTQDQEG